MRAFAAAGRSSVFDTAAGAERHYPQMVSHLARFQSERSAARAADHVGHDGMRILDVGAGAAQWSLAIVDRYSGCTVTALDLPRVIQTTKTAVEAAGHQDRFEYLAGDMFEVDLPPTSYDLVIVTNVCHLFGAPTNQALLRRLNRAIRAEGNLSDHRGGSPRRARDLTDSRTSRPRTGHADPGRQGSSVRYVSWLNSSGFVDVTRHELANEPPVSLVCASPSRGSESGLRRDRDQDRRVFS